MKKILNDNKKTLGMLLLLFMILTPFWVGIYFEYESCIVSCMLTVLLFAAWHEKGSLIFHWNDVSMAILLVVIFYGLSCLWAVDPGMAILGFFKYLPMLPFLLLIFQLEERERMQLLRQIPWTAVVMVVLSMLLSVIPALRGYLLVDGRQGGFFQYPNTFAVYLLIGLAILGYEKYSVKNSYIRVAAGILLIGIFFSGSRTVVALTAGVGMLKLSELLTKRPKENKGKDSINKTEADSQKKISVKMAKNDMFAPEQDKKQDKKVSAKMEVETSLGKKTEMVSLSKIEGILKSANNKGKLKTCIIVFSILTVCLCICFLQKDQIIELTLRYIRNPLQSSTLIGRILYMKDALGQIFTHPLGLGYMGYYFTQGQFQTGVYSVMYVHNDWLQFFLDIGWVPGLALLAAIVRSLFSPRLEKSQKMTLLVLFLHGMMDFNMQYLGMVFILLPVLDYQSEKASRLSKAVLIPVIICSVIGIYIGLGNLAYYLGQTEWAAKLYPYNTLNKIVLLENADTPEEMDKFADDILKQNSHAAIAWNAKGRAAYSRGEFDRMIEHMHKAMDCQKYDILIYEDYFDMLRTGVELYTEAGYMENAESCMEEIRTIQDRLDQVRDNSSSLAWMIRDVPELEMPEEYREYLQYVGIDQKIN